MPEGTVQGMHVYKELLYIVANGKLWSCDNAYGFHFLGILGTMANRNTIETAYMTDNGNQLFITCNNKSFLYREGVVPVRISQQYNIVPTQLITSHSLVSSTQVVTPISARWNEATGSVDYTAPSTMTIVNGAAVSIVGFTPAIYNLTGHELWG